MFQLSPARIIIRSELTCSHHSASCLTCSHFITCSPSGYPQTKEGGPKAAVVVPPASGARASLKALPPASGSHLGSLLGPIWPRVPLPRVTSAFGFLCLWVLLPWVPLPWVPSALGPFCL